MPYDSRKHHNNSRGIIPKVASAGLAIWHALDGALKSVGSRLSYVIAILTAAYFILSLIGVLPRPMSTPAPSTPVTPVAKSAPTDKKDITTGSIPQPSKPAPTPPATPQKECISESSHSAILDILAAQDDPPTQFTRRFEGRRLCAAWLLRVVDIKKVGSVWRVRLRASSWEWGPVVFADLQGNAASLEPGDLVKVEGTVVGYRSSELFRWGYVHLSSARVRS
jgi:hypothetical protein